MARAKKRNGSLMRSFVSLCFVIVPPVVAATALGAWWEYSEIEQQIAAKFEGRRWDFPSRIYSDSHAVYPGMVVRTDSFYRRLDRLGYRRVSGSPGRRGEYWSPASSPVFEVYLNSFDYPDSREVGRRVRMELDSMGRIRKMFDANKGREIFEFLLEPGLLADLHGDVAERRREMGLDEIPTALVRAVLATEDKRFFEHMGVDARSLARAVVVNLGAGGVQQGGSTVTQQLMKNFFLSDERTFSRKIREAAMAFVAEREYSKREILETYLNEIYFGQNGAAGIHGVYEASRFYFGRDPADLNLAQVATLAGIIRAPNYYSPHRHPERATDRRNTVLGLMQAQGDIDEATMFAAAESPLGVVKPRDAVVEAPYFVDYVVKELRKRYPRDVLNSEGYRIFTTLDPEMQAIAEGVLKDNLAEIEADIPDAVAKAGGQPLQGALVAVNQRTGAIRAMAGGRDYRESQFNRVTDMKRHPGSTFKPIVMLAALGSETVGAKHYRPTDTVIDERIEWRHGGSVWSPRNYENEFYGEVTIRESLEHSLNSATAVISRSVGINPIRDLAVRLGMDPKMAAFPSIVLGGWAIPPLDLAKVYSVFANGGVRASLRSVTKVLEREGTVVDGSDLSVRRVIPAKDAYLVTHMMSGVMERGTGGVARRKGFKHPAAGKTGTSNDYKDAWFGGFTPDLTAVVWVGFDKASSMGLAGSEAALPIWTDFMRQALATQPHTTFDVAPGIVLRNVDKKRGCLTRPGESNQIREAFLEGEEPTRYCN